MRGGVAVLRTRDLGDVPRDVALCQPYGLVFAKSEILAFHLIRT
jgi:hypothetical protein